MPKKLENKETKPKKSSKTSGKIVKTSQLHKEIRYHADNYKYKPEYRDLVRETIKEGDTINAFCVEVGVCKETVKRWREEHPDFDEAVRSALCHSELWWERLGKNNVGNSDFNTTLYIIQMRNRFGWLGKDPAAPNINLTTANIDEGIKAALEISQRAIAERAAQSK